MDMLIGKYQQWGIKEKTNISSEFSPYQKNTNKAIGIKRRVFSFNPKHLRRKGLFTLSEPQQDNIKFIGKRQ